MRNLPEVAVCGDEARAVAGAHGGVAERLREETLADADRAHQQHVLAAVEELQREGGVEQPAVEPDLRRPVEVPEAATLIEARLAEAQLEAAVVAPADLVREIATASGSRRIRHSYVAGRKCRRGNHSIRYSRIPAASVPSLRGGTMTLATGGSMTLAIDKRPGLPLPRDEATQLVNNS